MNVVQWSSARREERGLEGAAGRGDAGSPQTGRLGLWRSPVPRATRSHPGGRAAMQGHRSAASDAGLKRGQEGARKGREERKKEIRLTDGEKGRSGSSLEQRRPEGLGTVGEGEMGASGGKGRWRWKGQEEPARGGRDKR